MTYDPDSSGALSYLEAAGELADRARAAAPAPSSTTTAQKREERDEREAPSAGPGSGGADPHASRDRGDRSTSSSGTSTPTSRSVDLGSDGHDADRMTSTGSTTAPADDATSRRHRTRPDEVATSGPAGDGETGDGTAQPTEPATPSIAIRSRRETSSRASRATASPRCPVRRSPILPIASIRPNPRQPRTVFDEDDMAELVALDPRDRRAPAGRRPAHPRRVRPARRQPRQDGPDGGPRYELIMGERRLARLPGGRPGRRSRRSSRRPHDDDLLRDALLENLHRSQLNALEEAAAYQQLLDDFGCTHEELATRIGRSRPQISNTLRLLKLPPLVHAGSPPGVLSAGHARALLGLADGAAMERLAQRIVAEGLSVRTVEEIVALGWRRRQAAARAPPPARGQPAPAAGRPGRPALRPVRHPRQHRPGPAQGQAHGGVRLGRGPRTGSSACSAFRDPDDETRSAQRNPSCRP